MDLKAAPSAANAWSCEPREVHNHTMDSTRWYDFKFRNGDVVIASWAKAGTTWVQQIVAQLIFQGGEHIPILDVAPWIEHRCYPKREMFEMLEAQTHRRFMKSHLPADALTFSPLAKYIYVGRDGRDVIWSWYQHHKRLSELSYALLNDSPGRVGPPMPLPAATFRQCFHMWLDEDGAPLWPFWSHVASWWELRNRSNVLLVHFAELTADLPRGIRRIAEFLGAPADEQKWDRIVQHCSFEYMKSNANALSRSLDFLFVNGPHALVNQGLRRSWRGMLLAEDEAKYLLAAAEKLPPECGRWLATGKM
jgi:aryl sulfotransferase